MLNRPSRTIPAHRIAVLLLALAVALSSTACNRAAKKKAEEDRARFIAEEAEAAPIRRPLKEGESVVAEFAADGAWHPLPYSAQTGHVLRVEAFGALRNFGDNLVEFKLGPRSMILGNGREFVVSESVPFAVRVNPERVVGLGPSAQVQITRVR